MLAVLSLFDFTGNWSRPYRDAGYDVRQVDLQHGLDARLFTALPYPVRGVLAAPPMPATEGSRMHRLPPSADRASLRSETPMGFARAFFEANQ